MCLHMHVWIGVGFWCSSWLHKTCLMDMTVCSSKSLQCQNTWHRSIAIRYARAQLTSNNTPLLVAVGTWLSARKVGTSSEKLLYARLKLLGSMHVPDKMPFCRHSMRNQLSHLVVTSVHCQDGLFEALQHSVCVVLCAGLLQQYICSGCDDTVTAVVHGSGK